MAGCTLLLGLSLIGVGLLMAQEPIAIPKQRVNPKVLKEVLAEHPLIIPTAPQPHSQTLRDLRAIARDLEKAGRQAEANRLTTVIKDLAGQIEQELAEKKTEVARLNDQIDDLERAVGQ